MKITPKLVLGALSALCLLAAPACDKKDEKKDEKKADVKADEKKADEKKADDVKADDAKADGGAPADGGAAPADGGAADGGAAAAADQIGVPECDDYIAKMTKCLEGMDPAAAGAAKTGFDTVVKGWKDAVAANPDAKAALGTGCKAAMDGAATAYPDCFKAQ